MKLTAWAALAISVAAFGPPPYPCSSCGRELRLVERPTSQGEMCLKWVCGNSECVNG